MRSFALRIRSVALYSNGRSWWLTDRTSCFERVAKENNLEWSLLNEAPDQSPSILSFWTREQEEETLAWLRRLPKPLGLWGATDPMEIRIMNICQDNGFLIPDEISVLGTDNDISFCSMSSPELSSIDLAPEKVGYQGALLLDRKMNGEKIRQPVTLLVQPNGVRIRQSSDILAIDDLEAARVIRFIRENVTFGITVADVLSKFCLIPRTLERIVKLHLGRTPENEIIRGRLSHARELLLDTTLNIHEIAELSGFRSPEYFVKAFKKAIGQSPLKFRDSRGQRISTPRFRRTQLRIACRHLSTI